MGKNKKARKPKDRPAAKPKPPKPDLIKWGKYTLVYDPTASTDNPVEIKVKPIPRPKGGAAPSPAILKLAPNILVEDSPTPGAFPVMSRDLLRVTDKKIVSDAGGDYASIWLQLNRSYPDLATFLQGQADGKFELRVTLFLDLGGLVGAAAGIALPAGAISLPVPGTTNIRIRLVEQWKLSFSKFKWKEQKELELTKLPDADLEGLNDLAENGGALEITPDAGIHLTNDEVQYADESFIDADLRLLRPGKPDLLATYDPDLDLYAFDIPAPPGAKEGAEPGWVAIFLEVWVADEIENQLRALVEKTHQLDEVLKSTLASDAETFIQACLDMLAKKTVQELTENNEKFTNATHAVTYFEGFTLLAARGMENSLELHQKAYDRFMENLVNGLIELCFIGGDILFDWLLSKIIKNGKAAVEEELKREAKTLAEAAAESAERAILPKQQTKNATRDALASECKTLSEEVMGGIRQAGEVAETMARQEADIAEKKAAKELLQQDVEGLGKQIEKLEEESRKLVGELGELGGKVTETKTLREQAKAESEQLVEQIEGLRSQASGVRTEIKSTEESLATVTGELERSRSLLADKRGALQTTASELETAAQEVRRLRVEDQQIRQELGRMESLHTSLTTTMEAGHATNEELKTLASLETQMEAAAARSERIAGSLEHQQGLVAAKKTQKQELEGVVEQLDQQAKGLDAKSADLNSKIGGLDENARKFEEEALRKSEDQTKASARQSDLDQQLGGLQEQQTKLQDQNGKIADDVNTMGRTAREKGSQLAKDKEALDKLAEDLRRLGERREQLHSQYAEKIGLFHDKLPGAMEAELECQEIVAQLELLKKIKSSAHGTEAEFQAALEQAVRDIPSDQQMTRKVLESLKNNSGLKALEEWETQLKGLRAGLSGEDLARVDRTLATVEDSIKKVERAEKLWEGRSKIITGNIADTIKDELNERVKKIRDALQKMTHIEYKAVPAKYYDNTYFDQLCALCDSFLETLAGLWDRLMAGAASAHDWAHQNFGDLMVGVDKLCLYAIAAALTALDMFLQLLMKIAEGVLFICNSPMFASSWVHSDFRSQAKSPAADIQMPGSLDPEFFKFSNALVAKAVQKVHPKEIAQQSGGKAHILGAMKEEFKGYYKEYYAPQWERARQFMVAVAGGSGALNPKWLESEDVKSTNRDATQMLRAILKPMLSYSNSFESGEGGVLATIYTAYYTGEWTPHDADMVLEFVSWGASWGLRIGAMVFILIPPLEPAVVTMMEASDWSDRLFALARIGTTAFWTMPDILGSQFDVMRIYSLGYQNVFHGVDVSTAILDNREYAWGS